jgi:hypothetical protein
MHKIVQEFKDNNVEVPKMPEDFGVTLCYAVNRMVWLKKVYQEEFNKPLPEVSKRDAKQFWRRPKRVRWFRRLFKKEPVVKLNF